MRRKVADFKDILKHTKIALDDAAIAVYSHAAKEADRCLLSQEKSLQRPSITATREKPKKQISVTRLRHHIDSLQEMIDDRHRYETRWLGKRKSRLVKDIQREITETRLMLESKPEELENNLRGEGRFLLDQAENLVTDLQAQLEQVNCGGNGRAVKAESQDQDGDTRNTEEGRNDEQDTEVAWQSALPDFNEPSSYVPTTVWRDTFARNSAYRQSKAEWYTSEGDFGVDYLP